MTTTPRAPGAPESRPSPPQRGPFAFNVGPPQKAKHFKQSARRLIARLAPERAGFIGVLALAVSSVMLALPGPLLARGGPSLAPLGPSVAALWPEGREGQGDARGPAHDGGPRPS